jgi:hypothetical protein
MGPAAGTSEAEIVVISALAGTGVEGLGRAGGENGNGEDVGLKG